MKIHWRKDRLPIPLTLCFPCGSAGKESTFNAGDLGVIPGLGRFPAERESYPLQYSDLENLMDCIVHGIQVRILKWVAFPSPGDFPNPGIEPRSLALQVDSLPAEPQGKARIKKEETKHH